MKATKRGFTLLETAAVIGMVSLLAGVMMPAVQRARTDMRGAGSAANLALIGQGSAMYAQDNQGRLFTYTWEPGFHEMPDGNIRVSFSVQEAADWQQTAVLMRRTGRIDGPHRIQRFSSRLPHRRYSHLVLMDYMGTPFPSALFADPADANLLQWQSDPTDITIANNIPYAPGSNTAGYDDPGGWTASGVRQRWPFASSYQRTVSAWNPDRLPSFVPVSATPHLFQWQGGSAGLDALPAGRLESEVWFPSAKVHMFEEFDREQAGDPYFAYDHARPAKLMFDGSVNDFASGQANPSWNPANGKQEWRQTYVPIHTFPIPLGGLGDQTLLSQRYRWTLGGLKGIDYAAPLMGGRTTR